MGLYLCSMVTTGKCGLVLAGQTIKEGGHANEGFRNSVILVGRRQ